ncbi:nitrile hydratase subunit beta [Phenylobacterium montanum]|uniref:Nitrile hydratase subunit beta n=1 Tax=Phenylobacterium montanum TaxID=2823693 RepID=A0A975IY52_9CAUL|nr:nitrile hydratase subunit beta [Caulobacter sp. S6]QUD90091.1 nitrile hydratase subunit beta [Caulobacter sp. S6]
MNGVHDMGGMHGLGPIAPEVDEPLFHEPWEARALALTLAAGAWGRWNIDRSRHQRERIPGPTYLALGYYEKWITALIELMVQEDLVTREELKRGSPAAGAARLDPPLTAERVPGVLARGGPTERESGRAPRFTPGDRVRARNINPTGHTRLPRYARGHLGEVSRRHGAHVFPDANAHGHGEQPQPLYQVRFDAGELWGADAAFKGSVYLDLWEDYLEPA